MTSSKSPTHTRHRAALVALVTALIIAAIGFSSGRVSSQESEQRRDLEKVFNRHDRLSLDPGQITRQVKQTRSLTLTTSRGTFEMTLEPHDIRAPGYAAEARGDKGSVTILERGPVRMYKGTVQGLPGAQARFTIDEDTVEGLIVTPNEVFFIEPTKHFSRSAAKTDFVFYAAEDVKDSAGECGTTMAEMVEQHSTNVTDQSSAKGPQPEALFGPTLQIDVAAEADFEYVTALGGKVAAEQKIAQIMSEVDAIYNVQIGLRLVLIHTRVWDTASDPYTSPVAPETTVVATTALQEFSSYYEANAPVQAATRDVAHLFMGRDFNGATIGIAYRPGLDCNSSAFAYGISQHLASGNANLAGLAAHEIGHNLNAAHVTSTQGSDCTTSIMNPSLNAPPNNFCQFSRDEITGHAIDNRNCLAPQTQPGCSYSLSPSTQPLPSGAGGSSVNITTQAGCNWAVAEGAGWLTVTSGLSGTGNGTVNYTVTANTVCGPRTGLVSIGDKLLTVQQAGNPTYLTDSSTATAIGFGQTLNGDLSAADCTTGLTDRENAFMDRYKFNGVAGQNIKIEMNATAGLDTYLYLYGPSGGTAVAENDDIQLGIQTNSRILCVNPQNNDPCPDAFFTLPETGTYIIISTSYASGDSGGYSLTLTSELMLLSAQVTDSVGSAAAVNSVTIARTSNANNNAIRIFDPFNFSADQTTRLILFTSDLGLPQTLNPDPTVLSVKAGGTELVVEHVGPFTFPGSSGFPSSNGSYVVVALKRRDGQAMPTGSLSFQVIRNATLNSNFATITIVP